MTEPASTQITDAIQLYEKEISQCAKERRDKDIPNSTMEHAGIGIRYLIQNANDRIRILSTEFFCDFWKNMVTDLHTFLSKSKDNRIDLLVLESNPIGLKWIEESFGPLINQITIKSFDASKFSEASDMSSVDIPNFLVVNPVGYRYELSDREMKNSIVTGIINFGKTDITEKLAKTFDALFSRASRSLDIVSAS